MEDFAKLMQRLLEIQSGGRPRTSKLIAQDDRLIDRLEKRLSPEEPLQAFHLDRQ
jgi:hypothetical protein